VGRLFPSPVSRESSGIDPGLVSTVPLFVFRILCWLESGFNRILFLCDADDCFQKSVVQQKLLYW